MSVASLPATMLPEDVWPSEIRLHKDRRSVSVVWTDGRIHCFSAEFLRVNSPSAEVQGHSPAQKKQIIGKETVEILAIEPVGNYAVRLTFDDLHNTGLYTWDWFYQHKEQTISR